jgi:hypothetical protein
VTCYVTQAAANKLQTLTGWHLHQPYMLLLLLLLLLTTTAKRGTYPAPAATLRRPCAGMLVARMASGAALRALAVSWLGPLAYTACRGLP